VRSSRIASLFLTVLSLTLLTACGGPTSGGGPLPAPTLSNVTPAVAARGATVTLTGIDFGTTAGTVTVGGAPATISAWGNTSIQATVPDNAPTAWQNVAVTTATGTANRDGLFVGVEYTGAVGGLQTFLDEQSAGTAVLLPSTTFDLNSGPTELFVRNLELYGRGASETTLQLGPLHVVWLLADFGVQASLADLTINGGVVVVGADSPLTTAAVATAEEVEQLRSAARAVISLRGVRLEEATLATDPAYYSHVVDVHVQDSEVIGRALSLISYGDYSFDSLTMDSPNSRADVTTLVGSLVVQNSQFNTRTAEWAANGGVLVQDSQVHVTNGNLAILGDPLAVHLGTTLPGGPVHITGSTIQVLDGDLTDGAALGNLTLTTTDAPILVENNPLVRAWGRVAVSTFDTNLGAAGIRLAGNANLRAGVSPADDPSNPRLGDIEVYTESLGQPVLIQLADNAITAHGSLVIRNAGARDLRVTGNRMELSDGSTVGSFELAGTGVGPVTLTNNDITAASRVRMQALDVTATQFELVDNTFSLAGGALVAFDAIAANGACTFTGNTVDLQAGGANTAQLTFGCGLGAEPFVVENNVVSVAGGPGSNLAIISSGASEVTLSENELRTNGVLGMYADAPQIDVLTNHLHSDTEAIIFTNLV